MKARHSVSRSLALTPLRSLFGGAALAATFALTSPGVQIARAGDSAVADVQAPSSVEPGLVERVGVPTAPSCSQAPVAGRDDAFLRAQALLIQQEIARRAAGAPSGAQSTDNGIVLNGKGYNYGPLDGRQPGL